MNSSPPSSVICVSGMLRVLPPASPLLHQTSQHDASPPPQTPSNQISSSPHTPAEPQNPLSQKQVRELRRLCRKTANRAHFENRPIQLRQVASIAAMGAPSASLFDSHNLSSGAPLRDWVDLQRLHGADWRDERPLSLDAVEELRNWDRLLKLWAKIRFDPEDVVPTQLSFETVTPIANPLQQTPLHKNINNHVDNLHRLVPREVSFASPVSVDATPEPFKRQIRQPMAEVSINRVGDTINIYVPVTDDQENIHPNRRLPSHAADTAVSWRAPQDAKDSTHSRIPAALFRPDPAKPVKDWAALRRADRSLPDPLGHSLE